MFRTVCIAASWLPAVCGAESAVRKEVEFVRTVDAGFGHEVCVLGSHPQLGGGDPLRAVKLAWTPGNVWRGKVALEAGTEFGFSFVKRDFNAAAWGNPANLEPLGPAETVGSPDHEPPPWGSKCVLYRSGFERAYVLFRDLTHDGGWTQVEMRRTGPGRTVAESTYRVDGIAPSGSMLEFVFTNGSGLWDNAPAPPSGSSQGAAPAVPVPYQSLAAPYNYRTPLDVFLVQDGQVFNHLPAASPSAPRKETRQIASTGAGIPGRPVTVLLPRGYDNHPTKRYPVVYFQDGQNVFFPGGPFGTWDADRIANHEISQGRMRECILVAVPNGNDYGSNRLAEYLPDGETLQVGGQTHSGKAAAYTRFLWENVKAVIDSEYRTLGGAANTLTAGSSMGGLVADFIGLSEPGRFGGIGIFSPAYWTAPGWVAARDAAPKLPLRRYLSMGTAESGAGSSGSETHWRGALQTFDAWIRAGHVVHGDLLFEGVAGGAHNEAAWAARLPSFFAFALDPMRELSPLAQQLIPPRLTIIGEPLSGPVLRYTGLIGSRQYLESSEALSSWPDSLALPDEPELWQTRELEPGPLSPPAARMFWRLRQEAWPGW